MQEMLKDVGFGKQLGAHGRARDGVDGDYGRDTMKAVSAFQEANGIKPTGILDERTADALDQKHKQMHPEKHPELAGTAMGAPSLATAEPAVMAAETAHVVRRPPPMRIGGM